MLQLALRLMAERAGILHELGAGFEAAEAAASTLVAALGAPGVRSGAALDALVQRVQAAADAQNDAHAAPTPPPVHAPLLPARLLEPHAALAPPSSAAALAAADASGGEEERGAGAGAGAGDGRTRKEDEQDKRKSTSDVPGVLLPKRDNLRVRPRVRACATSVASGDECVPGDEWGCHDSDSDSDGDSDYVGKDTPRKRVVRKRGKASAPQPNGQARPRAKHSAAHRLLRPALPCTHARACRLLAWLAHALCHAPGRRWRQRQRPARATACRWRRARQRSRAAHRARPGERRGARSGR